MQWHRSRFRFYSFSERRFQTERAIAVAAA
jgi:hypothetical protein